MNKYDIVVFTEYGELNMYGIEAVSHADAKDVALELCRLAIKEAEVLTFELQDGK